MSKKSVFIGITSSILTCIQVILICLAVTGVLNWSVLIFLPAIIPAAFMILFIILAPLSAILIAGKISREEEEKELTKKLKEGDNQNV